MTLGPNKFTASIQGLFNMPVQNTNHKISARKDLAAQLLHIITPTIFDSLLCQKRQFTVQSCLRRCVTKEKIELSSQKDQNWKLFYRNFRLSKKVFFKKLPVKETDWTGPGLVPGSISISWAVCRLYRQPNGSLYSVERSCTRHFPFSPARLPGSSRTDFYCAWWPGAAWWFPANLSAGRGCTPQTGHALGPAMTGEARGWTVRVIWSGFAFLGWACRPWYSILYMLLVLLYLVIPSHPFAGLGGLYSLQESLENKEQGPYNKDCKTCESMHKQARTYLHQESL